jgi:DNA-binding beta-propeller fold protein YncE
MRRAALVALILSIWLVARPGVQAAPACRPVAQRGAGLSGRVDSLLALPSGGVAALVGAGPMGARFLPHDGLRLVSSSGASRRVRLPAYVVAPGLAAAANAGGAYVLIDTRLLYVDAQRGRVTASWKLDVRALGWPAAIATGMGSVFVAGQPLYGSPAAEVEALHAVSGGALHVVWRRSLGLTHAGIWLGMIGDARVAVYLPDAHDLAGTISVLDARTGKPVASESVPSPPVAVDASANRIYLNIGGLLRAITVSGAASHGPTIRTGSAIMPIAVDPAGGLVAFLSSRGLTLASARTLQTRAVLSIHSVSALAFSPRGLTLYVAGSNRLTTLNIARCAT